MAMGIYPRYEFCLTIKKIQDKNPTREEEMYSSHHMRNETIYKPEEEVVEELTFKALTAVEVIRKLIDYLVSK